ncbi:biotin/lipoyl-binding protein [Spirosoma endbachense]|uniref:Biotin/lipoyl-binding protein n=1 Tax=Spirosoma endbachense TaxID=2666025 RepID=A0A6P1VUP4_9BACT|nr:biotin/lipoyl-binding protein [Spirosoma endbachense]QHV95349.1 biotin/lipoyl-binding protein [Spirosoma endbachense]
MPTSCKLFSYIVLLSTVIVSSCATADTSTTKTQPMTYTVMKLAPRKAETNTDYPSSILGIQNVEIRAKIDGYVEKIYVDEGAAVKKGQPLFHINAP